MILSTPGFRYDWKNAGGERSVCVPSAQVYRETSIGTFKFSVQINTKTITKKTHNLLQLDVCLGEHQFRRVHVACLSRRWFRKVDDLRDTRLYQDFRALVAREQSGIERAPGRIRSDAIQNGIQFGVTDWPGWWRGGIIEQRGDYRTGICSPLHSLTLFPKAFHHLTGRWASRCSRFRWSYSPDSLCTHRPETHRTAVEQVWVCAKDCAPVSKDLYFASLRPVRWTWNIHPTRDNPDAWLLHRCCSLLKQVNTSGGDVDGN